MNKHPETGKRGKRIKSGYLYINIPLPYPLYPPIKVHMFI